MVLCCSSACPDFPDPTEGTVFYDCVQATLHRDTVTAWDSYALSMSEKNFVEVSVQTLRHRHRLTAKCCYLYNCRRPTSFVDLYVGSLTYRNS